MSQAPALLKTAALSIHIEGGPHKGQNFQLWSSPVRVGRDPENDIVLGGDQKVSRQHIEFQYLKGQWTVTNVSNGNHLLVNGEITKNRPLMGPVKIKIGESVLSITSEAFPLTTLSNAVSRPKLASVPAPKAQDTNVNFPRPSARTSEPLLEPGSQNRITKILIGLGAAIAVLYFMQPTPKPSKASSLMKHQEESVIDIKKSEEVVEGLNKKRLESNQDKIQYQLAQEQFLRGFRDYKQGQYGLAYTELGAALTLYPEHKLARTYYEKARNKFYAKVEVLMTEGKRYRGTSNYRLCKAAFMSAMVMLKVESDPLFKESNQYYQECSQKLLEGSSQ